MAGTSRISACSPPERSRRPRIVSFLRRCADRDLSESIPLARNRLCRVRAGDDVDESHRRPASTGVPRQGRRAAATSPAVIRLLGIIPAANFHQATDASTAPADFTGFTGGAVANVSLDQGSGDIDIELRQQDRIHGYYVVQKDLRQEPLLPTVADSIPGFGDTRDGFRQLMTLSEDHTFNASLANTVRLAFNRIHLTFIPTALLDPAHFNITLPPGSPVAT